MKIIFSFLLSVVTLFCVAQAPQLIIPRGHNADITFLATSPDKKLLASGDDKGTIKLWDMQTGKELQTFVNNPEFSILDRTTGLVFSPDNKKLYTGIGDKLIINDLSNAGKEIFNKKIHDNSITQIVFSSNGKIFATAADEVVKIWDADNPSSPKMVAVKGKKTKLSFDDANNIVAITTGNYSYVNGSFDIVDVITNKGYITHINTATGQVTDTDDFESLQNDGLFINPSGKMIAITRYEESAGTVQLLDIGSKRIIKKFTGIEDSSISLFSFSRNNRYMATKAGTSIILYDLNTLAYVKTFYSEDVFASSMSFSADGTKLFQGINSNGSIVQLNLSESKVEKVFGSEANAVKDLAVTPGNQSLVLLYGTSDYRSKKLLLQKLDFNSSALAEVNSKGITNKMQDYDIASAGGGRLFDPEVLKSLDQIFYNKLVTAFSISTNNKILVATNKYESPRQLSFYNLADGKKIRDVSLKSPVYSLLFSKDDKIVYVGYEGDNAIDKIEVQTGTILKTFGHINSYSKDRRIKRMLLSKDETILLAVNDINRMYSWNTVTGLDAKLNVSADDMKFSLKSMPNANAFVYADGKTSVEVFDLSANKVIRSIKCNSRTIGALDVTPDGKFIFYGNNDKSVSILDVTKGELVATMVFFGEKDWVIVDKAGRFDGTQAGMHKMHYVKAGEILPLESGYEQFYTPNLLPRILNNEKFTVPVVNINEIKTPPTVKVSLQVQERNLEVGDDIKTIKVDKEQVTIKAEADGLKDVVSEIRLYQNGKLVHTTRNLTVEDENKGEKTMTKTFSVTLNAGVNNFKAVAINSQRSESLPAELIADYKPSIVPAKVEGNDIQMYLLVVGINAYKNPKYTLNYAQADAAAFTQALSNGSSSLFSKVNTTVLTDAQATKEGMMAAFEKIKGLARPKDLFVFYYAGHGVVNDKKEFFLVPYDVIQLYGNDGALEQKGFSAAALQQVSKEIKAQKQLFILDACQSAGALETVAASRGAAEEKAIAQLARSTGTQWLTASGSEQFASEFSQLGHGSFTYCLLEAFKGDANTTDKKLTVKQLDAYLQTKVPEVTQKYKGTPQYPASYSYGNDFPIIIIK